MSPDLKLLIESNQQRVNRQLQALASAPAQSENNAAASRNLRRACDYVVGNGGKRIRPNLLYLAADAITAEGSGKDCSPTTLDYAACAVELLHTYSLVHDDLPAMDDDDLRRGQPSCHVAFDEATAILVGDALQARAFELLAIAPDVSPRKQVSMVAELARAAGVEGMVGGQYIDITATDSVLGIDQLQSMHELKTGAVICAALAIGGIARGATDKQLAALAAFGRHIGLAFQVVDDILDVTENSTTLGKTSGKDDRANKPTYVSLLGVEGSRQKAGELLEQALEALTTFGAAADPLRGLASYIVDRDH